VKLVVNGTAVSRTSLGGKRYFNGIFQRLEWDWGKEVRNLKGSNSMARIRELTYLGRKGEIYWSPNQRGPIMASNHIVTVLDCINVEYVYRKDWRLSSYRRLFSLILNNATAVVAISHATRDSILRNYKINPNKIIVIPGPNDFRTEFSLQSLKYSKEYSFAAEQPFVLLFSNLLPHKNTGSALTAFAASTASRRDIALRVVGPVDATALALCRAAGVTVEHHIGIDDMTLQAWMRSCCFLLSPSLEEGLNLPIGEAISMGVNVLCSDIAVHREFFDGPVRFFDPKDISSIVHALDLAFDDSGSWACKNPFSYSRSFDDVTKEYLKLFQQIALNEAAC